uniref:COMM domain-containing protein 5 n=1 Tax=Neogobius melanostomus TaxID=47308 RepID=A0A8C6SGH0_9GOBI
MSTSHAKEPSFLGGRIPDVDHDTFRKLLKGKDSRDVLKSVAENCTLPPEKLSRIVAAMYHLLSEAVRVPMASLKQEVRTRPVTNKVIPEEFISDFCSVVFGSRRAALEAAAAQSDPRLPSLQEFRWRVDVAISTGSLSRALQPSVLMQLRLSDGSVQQLQVPVTKFQELRYNVALILKEMNDLEKCSILQIQD